jgi:dTDP-4-dehydrorhamnose 3,5-epimerase-like enzyme
MKYTQTEVDGVIIVDIEPHTDERGFFSRPSVPASSTSTDWKPPVL